jgi:hypothetical protein
MKLTYLSLPALALAGPLALQQRQSSAQVLSMTATGEGCPPGSFSTLIDEHAISAKASFDVFGIVAGQNVPVLNKSLACDVAIAVSFPGTCKQAVMRTRTDAFVLVAMDAGATAKVSTQFSVTGGVSGGSPPDLVYTSVAGENTSVDIGRGYEVSISATGQTATFVAHLEIYLDAPVAEFASQTVLDGFGLAISQEGLC